MKMITYTGDTVTSTMSKPSERRSKLEKVGKKSTVAVATYAGVTRRENLCSLDLSQMAKKSWGGRKGRGRDQLI